MLSSRNVSKYWILISKQGALEMQHTETTDSIGSVEIQKQYYKVGRQVLWQFDFSIVSLLGNIDPIFIPIKVVVPQEELNLIFCTGCTNN